MISVVLIALAVAYLVTPTFGRKRRADVARYHYTITSSEPGPAYDFDANVIQRRAENARTRLLDAPTSTEAA